MGVRNEASIGLLVEGELTDAKEDQRIDDPTQDPQHQDDPHRVPGLSTQQFYCVSSGPGLHCGEQPPARTRSSIRIVRHRYILCLACNGCSYVGVVLQLIEKHMRSTSINNMNTGHVGQGIQTSRDFRDHPTINDAFLDQCMGLRLVEFCKVRAISKTYPIHITQKNDPLGFQAPAQVSCAQVTLTSP